MDGSGARRTVATLADDVYDLMMAAEPLGASLIGDDRFAADLPDRTADGLRDHRRRVAELRAELGRRAPGPTAPAGGDAEASDMVGGDGAVTADVVAHVLDAAAHEHDAAYVRFAVGSATSGGAHGDAAVSAIGALSRQELTTPELAEGHVARCRSLPAHLRDAAGRLADGVGSGHVPSRRLLDATVGQLGRYLDSDLARDPLLVGPPDGWTDAGRWRDRLADVVADEVRPAVARYRTALLDGIAPHARPDDLVGLCHLPGGADAYDDAVAVHTTTAQDARHWHDTGWALLEALDDEYRALGATVLGTSDRDEIFGRLRTDPALRFDDADQIVAVASEALRRAEAVVGDWVASPPGRPCRVAPIPELEAPDTTIAYYQPPSQAAGRPGTYYVNTHDPTSRTRFEAEALAFHESVPGHHTQIAVAVDLDLPRLQRVWYVTAFAEGWGLYSERLADEMGLYSDDRARLGMLSFDSWRACRLVVDTGMHAFGWSRDRAVEVLRRHSPQAFNNIDNEVDRYIGWPGQALAYMAGRERLLALRRRAAGALGDRFDLPEFHDVVLGHAAVPLTTLDRLVDAWIARRAAR